MVVERECLFSIVSQLFVGLFSLSIPRNLNQLVFICFQPVYRKYRNPPSLESCLLFVEFPNLCKYAFEMHLVSYTFQAVTSFSKRVGRPVRTVLSYWQIVLSLLLTSLSKAAFFTAPRQRSSHSDSLLYCDREIVTPWTISNRSCWLAYSRWWFFSIRPLGANDSYRFCWKVSGVKNRMCS